MESIYTDDHQLTEDELKQFEIDTIDILSKTFNNIQEYCKNITKEGLKTIDKNKIWYEEDNYRAWHLFGLFPKKNLKKILKKIREKNIHISLRGETIRVSPNVYNNKRELDKFFNTISENI